MKRSESLRRIRTLVERAEDTVRLLGLGEYSSEDQMRLVVLFSTMVLNRILMSVPDGSVEAMKAVVARDDTDPASFAEALEECVPDLGGRIGEIMDMTAREFDRYPGPGFRRGERSDTPFVG